MARKQWNNRKIKAPPSVWRMILAALGELAGTSTRPAVASDVNTKAFNTLNAVAALLAANGRAEA
jgi:hypothetical protein